MYSKTFANTTMDTTTLIAYVVNCSVCFTIGLMFLLTPAQKTSEGKIESFSMARMCLAGSSFLESIVSFFTISVSLTDMTISRSITSRVHFSSSSPSALTLPHASICSTASASPYAPS